MNTPDLKATFDALFTPATNAATAPMAALALGVMLFLVCDIVDALKPARRLVFLGSLALSALFHLRILGMETAPGLVLDGTFQATPETALWGLIFLIGTLLAWSFSHGYYRQNLPFKPEHDALFLSAAAGMMVMVGASDLIVFFVGLELLSIPLYALAAFRRARVESIESGLKYFLLGAFSSAIYVYGCGLLFAATGTLGLRELFASDLSGALAITGIALIAASLFFKVSVFPFHLWVPDVYQGAPTPVTVLMATGTKAAAFGFLVSMTRLMPAEGATAIALIALVTMALGNLGALVQGNLKRMLAYSGVAHAGTLLLLIAAGLAGAAEEDATRAALYYMGAYLFTASGAFGVLSLLESDGEHFTELRSLRGLSSSRPGAAAALALFMLSLGGIPATGGFLGKWFVFTQLVNADMILVAVLGALLSVIALGYYLRVIVTMYMEPAPVDLAPPTTRKPWTAGLATAACCLGVLAMGLFPGFFLAPLS